MQHLILTLTSVGGAQAQEYTSKDTSQKLTGLDAAGNKVTTYISVTDSARDGATKHDVYTNTVTEHKPTYGTDGSIIYHPDTTTTVYKSGDWVKPKPIEPSYNHDGLAFKHIKRVAESQIKPADVVVIEGKMTAEEAQRLVNGK